MTLDTNLNSPPYYDDFDDNNNYHRILFKPSVAVQARELTQLQTNLQDQIEKFGKSVYVDGSIVSGVGMNFDDDYRYVKIKDNYTSGSSIDMTGIVGYYVKNSSGVTGLIVNSISGFESNYPSTGSTTEKRNSQLNTLFVKYTATAGDGVTKVFSADDILTVQNSSGSTVIGTVTVANSSTYPVGSGYAMSVSDGVIFQKGFFVKVQPQTVVVNSYFTTSDGYPDGVSVGFNTVESIVTSNIDDSLLDNAMGAPNYAAPGADRLKLTPTLAIRTTSTTTDTTSFNAIVDFVEGKPSVIRRNQYSNLGDEMARRTYEESGNYVVNPFPIRVKSGNTTYLKGEVGAGIGYVQGYRVEIYDKINTNIRRGTDTETAFSQIVSANYGSYVFIREYVGDFNFSTLTSVDLYNSFQTAVTGGGFLSTGITGTKIGTANVRGVKIFSGNPGSPSAIYKLYLFNINMLSGYSFDDVKSTVITSTAIADLVTEVNSTTLANTAVLKETEKSAIVFPIGQKAISALSNTSFTYRNRQTTVNFNASGVASMTLSGEANDIFPYGITTLSDAQEADFIFVVSSAGNTAVKTGTVSVNSTSNVVVGTSTTFLTDYAVGDFITANSYGTRAISTIANNTYLTVSSPFTGANSGQGHYKSFPVGTIIPFTNRINRTIQITANTTATINMAEALNITPSATVYYDVKKGITGSFATPKSKTVAKSRYVKINASNAVNGTTGPWCLGLPDVIKLRNVYVGSSGSYPTPGSDTDFTSNFILDSGQRDTHYGLGYLKLSPTSSIRLTSNTRILALVDHLQSDPTTGSHSYFTVASYPVDDANTANVSAITTQEIPKYISTITGNTYYLRSCIDFRQVASNTAVSNTDSTYATENPSDTLTFNLASSKSYIVSPDSTTQADVTYYLGRYDTVSINPQTKINITEGIPSKSPRTVSAPTNSMLLGTIYIPPYPSLDPVTAFNYDRQYSAVNINSIQNRRFTMKDIGVLRDRIDRLEYYVSLSLLEQSTKDLTISNATTGIDRFKNGFLVDPFVDHSIGDRTDPGYNIALDSSRAEIRPVYRLIDTGITFNSSLSTNYKQKGNAILLPYSNTSYISQPYASKSRNLNDLSVYHWIGSMNLQPNVGSPDINSPIINNTGDDSVHNTSPGGGYDTGGGTGGDSGSDASTSTSDASPDTSSSSADSSSSSGDASSSGDSSGDSGSAGSD